MNLVRTNANANANKPGIATNITRIWHKRINERQLKSRNSEIKHEHTDMLRAPRLSNCLIGTEVVVKRIKVLVTGI
jgi:hypothetical protein